MEKVIIDQEYFQKFANTLSPGAYISLTRVDFKALDKVKVSPVGIYGGKEEITSILFSTGAIDHATCVQV